MRYFFLKSMPVLIVMSMLNNSCKKSGNVPEVHYKTLKVLEKKTNLPVAGATVKIYKAIDIGYGVFREGTILGTLTTDKDGKFKFDSELGVNYAIATHNKYWAGSSGGSDMFGSYPFGNIYLAPVGYTKIHLKKINTHLSGLLLTVKVSEDPSPPFDPGSGLSFNQPADTTILMMSYGNTNYIINWYFIDGLGNTVATETGGQIPGYYVNRFDTVSVEINY
ncbi:MAG: hypothetical protein QM668_21930 [Agriterribacter sp.]